MSAVLDANEESVLAEMPDHVRPIWQYFAENTILCRIFREQRIKRRESLGLPPNAIIHQDTGEVFGLWLGGEQEKEKVGKRRSVTMRYRCVYCGDGGAKTAVFNVEQNQVVCFQDRRLSIVDDHQNTVRVYCKVISFEPDEAGKDETEKKE